MNKINFERIEVIPEGTVGKIISKVIGFEKWVLDNYYKYHFKKYPDSFTSKQEQQTHEELHIR